MHLRISIGYLLMVLCLGECSSPAVSSISVHRHDIPLSYKYSAIHIYSTEKPRNVDIRPEYTTPLYKSVQYAPLILNRKEKTNLYTQAFIGNQNKAHLIINRDNTKNHLKRLEPQESSDNETFQSTTSAPVQAIAGYNIDPSTLNGVRQDGILFRQPSNIDHVTKLKKSPVLNLNIDMKETVRLRKVIEKNVFHDEKPVKTVHVLFSMENAHIQPASDYAKTPYLHLNVARSYNIARSPHKAHIKEYVNKDRHSTLLERNSFFYSMPNIKYVL